MIGTSNGLVKFDGINWIVYDTTNSALPDNRISKISIANGEIWLATSESNLIVRFIDQNNCLVYNNSVTGIPAGSGVSVNGIAIDSADNKWFAHNFGLTKFDGITWKNVISFSFFSITVDNKGIF